MAIAVGFDTLCRRGELVAISVEDMTADKTGRYTVLVRRAKNDPDGAGRTAKLSSGASVLVREWLERTGITSGPLLRAVYQGHVKEDHLQPITVARILKKVAGRVDLEEEKRRKVRGPFTPRRRGAAADPQWSRPARDHACGRLEVDERGRQVYRAPGH